jgi:hypothetical protein
MAFVPLNTNNSDLANYNNVNNALRDLNNKKIKNADLSITSGEPGGVWKSWTPTFTNLSGGTLNYAKYTQIGKTVHFRFKYTLGGAGVSGSVTFSLPVNLNADYNSTADYIHGTASLFDFGTASYIGVIRWASSSTLTIRALNAALSYAAGGDLSSSVPHTWANTDVIQVTGTYEAA